MKVIVLTDDQLKRLEARFGPCVRQMGSWYSDGTFGYASVPVIAVEKAAGTVSNPTLALALSRLIAAPENTQPFIELLEAFGSAFVEKIVDAYRECSLGLLAGPRLAKPPQSETRRSSVAVAAG